MNRALRSTRLSRLAAGLLASGVALSSAGARADGADAKAQTAAGPRERTKDRTKDRTKSQQPTPRATASVETAVAWRSRHSQYYQRNWGIDIVGVRPVSSGFMLRFDYRVVDPQKASALTDRKSKPYLIDERTRTALAVPAMENIGELRQVAPLELHRTYFMIFGNPGGLVKNGSRVTLVVGNLRVEGLVVG